MLFSYGYPSSYAPPGTATYSSGVSNGYEDNSDDYYVDEEVDAPWNRDYDDEDQVRCAFIFGGFSYSKNILRGEREGKRLTGKAQQIQRKYCHLVHVFLTPNTCICRWVMRKCIETNFVQTFQEGSPEQVQTPLMYLMYCVSHVLHVLRVSYCLKDHKWRPY